jgi:hypothetical protein
MRIQTGVIVPLGYGKYVRSDRVTSVVPIEDERGPGRRTFVYVEEQKSRWSPRVPRTLWCATWCASRAK